MNKRSCNITTDDGQYFDITHTFKIGPSTYHVLGCRKNRPTYKNTYYIFNCLNDQHQSTNESFSRTPVIERSRTASEKIHSSKYRSSTIYDRKSTTTANFGNSQEQKTRSMTISRARTQSPQKMDIDMTALTETVTKAMKTERKLFMSSLRREMNLKKNTLIKTIKKEQATILKATAEATDKRDIVRLLEEQKSLLEIAFGKFVNDTTTSINTLKQVLAETLDMHRNASETMNEKQVTLITTIEQELQKLILKNEEILESTSSKTSVIDHLQSTLVEKIDTLFREKKKHDDALLNRLFAEQQQAFTEAIKHEQQEPLSAELIKQTMITAMQEERLSYDKTNNYKRNTKTSSDNMTINVLDQQTSINNSTVIENKISNTSSMKLTQNSLNYNQSSSKSPTRKSLEQQLFKVSIRSPVPAHILAKLTIGGKEYPRRLHTLCQRDAVEDALYNCYVAPPARDGPYDITIYAKTDKETTYRAAIHIRLPGSCISQSITFPLMYQSFEEHQCILIEPMQRLLKPNELVLIHMIVPGAQLVKITNGDDTVHLDINEYKNGVIRKKLRVRGDVCVVGCWEKQDSNICLFNMIR